jgi:hypothetical protein
VHDLNAIAAMPAPSMKQYARKGSAAAVVLIALLSGCSSERDDVRNPKGAVPTDTFAAYNNCLAQYFQNASACETERRAYEATLQKSA